jgi:hypothetical protein
MKRIIMMLTVAALMVAALTITAPMAFAISPADAEALGCSKVKGDVVCTVLDFPGNSEDNANVIPGGTATNTTKTKGNLENLSPEPQGVGTTCTGPPGRCK